MKRKILCALLCAAMAASLMMGCGNSEDNDAGTASDQQQTEETPTEEAEEETEEAETAKVEADPVDKTKVYVSPDWVQSVLDGGQEESKDYVILECAWGEEADDTAYGEGHIQGA